MAQGLPTQFPCWCKAVYSWGGETKRDLGFIEGDLIECLNAGDGSWWMGRLRRDRRMVGLFPSNFVELLPTSFQPGQNSPLPSRQNSANMQPQPAQKAKSTFRKPFQAYSKAGSPNPDAAKRELDRSASHLGGGGGGGAAATSSPAGSLRKSLKPYSSMKRTSNDNSNHSSPGPASPAHRNNSFRAISPVPRAQWSQSRAVSPAPPSGAAHLHRAVSPAPAVQYHSHSRTPSPNPYQQYDNHSRQPSYQQEWDQQSPPPPPPAHRYVHSRVPSPQPYNNGHRTPEPATPLMNLTPSPIANAMNDVMNCFEDMAIAREPTPEPPREPSSVWSPAAFDELYADNLRKARPHTVMGSTTYSDQDDRGDMAYGENYRSGETTAPANVSDYVERMEARLRQLHEQDGTQPGQPHPHDREDSDPPEPPPKNADYESRSKSSLSIRSSKGSRRGLRHVRSGYDIGKQAMSRTFTLKSTSTTTTNSSSSTNHTLMSGTSAGGFSATSAGSFYRRKWSRSGEKRPMSVMDLRQGAGSSFNSRPTTPMTGISYHSSHASNAQAPDTPASSAPPDWYKDEASSESVGILGGLSTPKARKSGFFKKMVDSARTGAATARSTITNASSRPGSPTKMSGFAGGLAAAVTNAPSRPQSAAAMKRPTSSHAAARDMGLGSGIDWVQVRRDINRSNTVSRNEKLERAERCQMLDVIVMQPTDELLALVEGDEGLDGLPVHEPTDFASCNLQMVDKSARFVNSAPGSTSAAALVQGYLCRPYRSDIQRLRAIFTWVSERIGWEEDFEIGEYVDTRRVLSQHRGCSQEIAYLVADMCSAVGIHAEVVHGHLKAPGELADFDAASRPNHWWNAVIVDGEWRMMDCALASPSHSRRALYSSAGASVAEGWFFLARPMEMCYTHVPVLPEQQHLVPPAPVEILMALPLTCPNYFRSNLQMVDFCTSLLYLENLEMAHVQVAVPEDIECVAEIEVGAIARDADGDFFESGDVVRKPALAQPEWVGGRKRFVIKALLPGDVREGVLKVYAGKRGLMHTIKSNPHSLALTFPLTHTGSNPPYDFFTRHPTPHAQRHDLYVAQPQCQRLVANNTFIFSVRQHPSTLTIASPALASSTSGITFSNMSGRVSPNPYARPTSAMSMASASNSGSNYSHPSSNSSSNPSQSSAGSDGSGGSQKKPAKLAIQSPSGKIIRLTRKAEHMLSTSAKETIDGSEWETVIKVGERGIWRGLVLADRSARWCVFAEWECV